MKNKGLDDVIQKLVQFEQQLRIIHWQTTNYEKHTALGIAYEGLGDLIDTFVEISTGKYGLLTLTDGVKLANMTGDKDLTSYLDAHVKILASLTEILDPATDSDLLNIRDELLAIVNHLRYRLTLK